MFCGRCGQEMQDGTQFCPRCGLAQKVQTVAQAKPAKKSIAQQVAELTPKEKKTVMKIGSISLTIAILALVALVLYGLQFFYLQNERDEAFDAYMISSEEGAFLTDYEAHEETWDRYEDAKAAADEFVTISLYVWLAVFVVVVMMTAAVYSHFPFYKERRFYYMLFHKDAR